MESRTTRQLTEDDLKPPDFVGVREVLAGQGRSADDVHAAVVRGQDQYGAPPGVPCFVP